jgi:hypothetical protein
MTATTTLPGTEVAVFAAAVRAALSDLPPDDLDEITEGLEADLAERAADSGDRDLGDPTAYADELRAAAGYPPRSARSHLGDALPDLRTLPRELRHRWEALVARHSLIASIVSFFVALRPVWWVLRGIAVYALAVSFLGGSYYGATWWPIAVAAVVLSVQVGRGRMLGRGWARWTMRIASAVAIIALPFLAGWAATQVNLALSQGYYTEEVMYPYPQGLTYDGTPVDNIFAYDSAGQPIDQVQLFDQDGDPLNTVSGSGVASEYMDAQDGSGAMLVPSWDVPGRAGWNVFPLAHVDDWADYADDNALDDSEVVPTEFPVASVKPLAGHEPTLAPTTPMTDVAAATAPAAP